MTTISILKRFVFAFALVAIASCDSEYNELGSDIIEDDIHHDNITRLVSEVVAYDRATGAVQSNNLPQNSLGVYDNAVFGKTISHFVTQLELARENPQLHSPTIDSVYLHIPYSSTLTATDGATGASTYTLNNVYGNADAKMRLSVYRSNYFLRSVDPAAGTAQQYFSNQKGMIEGNLGPKLNTSADLNQNEQFSFSAAEVVRRYGQDGSKIAERLKPGIFMNFDKDYFFTQLFGTQADGKLLNNNVFKEYFRGLYFKIEQTGPEGAMLYPNFSEGKIVVIYHDSRLDVFGNEVRDAENNIIRDRKVININLAGNTVNFFDKTYNTDIFNALQPAANDMITGNDRIYVNGGEGALAAIKLNQGDLDALMPVNNDGKRVLINEANLSFYIDRSATGMGSTDSPRDKEPLRVYLYDLENNIPLYDYSADASTNSSNASLNKTVYSGIRQTTADGRSLYKIRITNHINNIITKDSTNVPLGLVVTENINLVGNAAINNNFEFIAANGTLKPAKRMPVSSVISPVGTVLYGNNIQPVNPDDVTNPKSAYNQRLKLEIYYTKPD